jgi:hypothetical protein
MLVEPLADVDVNVPGVMAMLVESLADQLSVLLVPGFMLGGFAVKDAICGTEPFPVGVGEFAEVPAAQPARPAQQTRARTSAQISSSEEVKTRDLSVIPQNELGESMADSFTGVDRTSLGIAGFPCLLVGSTGLDYWSTASTGASGGYADCNSNGRGGNRIRRLFRLIPRKGSCSPVGGDLAGSCDEASGPACC